MSEFMVDMRRQGEAVVVKMAGDASVGSIAELERQFTKIQAMRPNLVVLDMGELNFIASIGMGTLVSLQRSVTRNGGSIKLAGVNENVQGALKRAGLDQVFDIHDTPDAALA